MVVFFVVFPPNYSSWVIRISKQNPYFFRSTFLFHQLVKQRNYMSSCSHIYMILWLLDLLHFFMNLCQWIIFFLLWHVHIAQSDLRCYCCLFCIISSFYQDVQVHRFTVSLPTLLPFAETVGTQLDIKENQLMQKKIFCLMDILFLLGIKFYLTLENLTTGSCIGWQYRFAILSREGRRYMHAVSQSLAGMALLSIMLEKVF